MTKLNEIEGLEGNRHPTEEEESENTRCISEIQKLFSIAEGVNMNVDKKGVGLMFPIR